MTLASRSAHFDVQLLKAPFAPAERDRGDCSWRRASASIFEPIGTCSPSCAGRCELSERFALP